MILSPRVERQGVNVEPHSHLLCTTEAWYGNEWNSHTVNFGFTETIYYDETDLKNASHDDDTISREKIVRS
jgi:hypothetical protein